MSVGDSSSARTCLDLRLPFRFGSTRCQGLNNLELGLNKLELYHQISPVCLRY